MDLHHLPEGTHSLAPRPGTPVRLTFQIGLPSRRREYECERDIGPLSLDRTTARSLRPSLRSERRLVHPAGLSPADSPFEAEDDNNFTTDAEIEPMERLALSWGMRPAVYPAPAGLLSLLSHIGEMACQAVARRANVDGRGPASG